MPLPVMAFRSDRLPGNKRIKEGMVKEYSERVDIPALRPLRGRLPTTKPKAKEKKADHTEEGKECIAPASISALRARQGSASGPSNLSKADSATPSRKRTCDEIMVEDRRDGNADVESSASNQGIVPLIVVQYEGRAVAVRRRSNYEATIKSVREVFPSLRSLNHQNIRLSAVLQDFGEDPVEIFQDVWSDLVSQLKTVQVVAGNQEMEEPSADRDHPGRKQARLAWDPFKTHLGRSSAHSASQFYKVGP